MADQNITALPVATSPASSDQLLLVGATEEKLIDYDKLADAILTKLTSKQYTLDQGTKTLPAALNELYSNPAFGEHIVLGNSKNAIKITPSVSYQIFFVYGYLSGPWMGVIVSEGKVIGFKFEKVGSEPVSIEKSGEDSLILKYSKIWGQVVISSKYAFNYELLQI